MVYRTQAAKIELEGDNDLLSETYENGNIINKKIRMVIVDVRYDRQSIVAFWAKKNILVKFDLNKCNHIPSLGQYVDVVLSIHSVPKYDCALHNEDVLFCDVHCSLWI